MLKELKENTKNKSKSEKQKINEEIEIIFLKKKQTNSRAEKYSN